MRDHRCFSPGKDFLTLGGTTADEPNKSFFDPPKACQFVVQVRSSTSDRFPTALLAAPKILYAHHTPTQSGAGPRSRELHTRFSPDLCATVSLDASRPPGQSKARSTRPDTPVFPSAGLDSVWRRQRLRPRQGAWPECLTHAAGGIEKRLAHGAWRRTCRL